jgi:hypothetical protein
MTLLYIRDTQKQHPKVSSMFNWRVAFKFVADASRRFSSNVDEMMTPKEDKVEQSNSDQKVVEIKHDDEEEAGASSKKRRREHVEEDDEDNSNKKCSIVSILNDDNEDDIFSPSFDIKVKNEAGSVVPKEADVPIPKTMQKILDDAKVEGFEHISVAIMTTMNGLDHLLLRKNEKETSDYAGCFNLIGAKKITRTYMRDEVVETVKFALKEQIYVDLNINELVQSTHKVTAFTSEYDASELVIVVPMVGICKDAIALKENKKPAKQRSKFEYFSLKHIRENEKGVTSFLVKRTYEKIFEITNTVDSSANFTDFGKYV